MAELGRGGQLGLFPRSLSMGVGGGLARFPQVQTIPPAQNLHGGRLAAYFPPGFFLIGNPVHR